MWTDVGSGEGFGREDGDGCGRMWEVVRDLGSGER
jgi:hypothetical protein